MQAAELYNVEVFGVNTRYARLGNPEGRTLLMVHGFRGDHHGLLKIAENLADFNVIIPDLPGFGSSSRLLKEHTLIAFAEWLIEFAKKVTVEDYDLLAHSFGTLVAGQAISNGLKPSKLVLVNPISQPALEGPKRVLTNAAVVYYRLGAVMPACFADPLLKHPLIVRIMSETMTKSRNKELRAWIHDQHDQYFSDFSDRKSLLEAFKASVSHNVGEFAPSILMKTLILVGDRDDITPLTSQLKLHYSLQDSELIVLNGTGHLVHYEKASESASEIDRFLETTRNNG